MVESTDPNSPALFVNIGIPGFSVGTVSSVDGTFELKIPEENLGEILRFSCIGFESKDIPISELSNSKDAKVLLTPIIYSLDEVMIKPNQWVKKTLGHETTNSIMHTGFSENKLGKELGVILKVKKRAFLEQFNVFVAECTYDSLFFRINVYKVIGKGEFENILTEPIYIELSKEDVKDVIRFDLTPYNIYVEGDAMISLELITNLGEGELCFSTRLRGKTYFRSTSQSSWTKVGIGVGFHVDVELEK